MDHTKYPRGLKSKSISSLHFIIRDAREAIKANPENPNAGYYADEISYAAMEIRRRREGGKMLPKIPSVYIKKD